MFPPDRSTIAPTRLIGRLAAEMALHALVATRRRFGAAFDAGATFDRVALFLTLLRHANLPHGSPFDGARALSISGMAASMDIPFETARRHGALLVDHGLATRKAGGLTLAADLHGNDMLTALQAELHDLMVAQIDDLKKFEIPMPTARPGSDYRPTETLTALLDTVLALLDTNRAIYGSSMTAIVANAIISANVRQITYHPELARRYARLDTIPPDHLRLPVRRSALSRALGIPYSTVARQVAQMIEVGLVTSSRAGLTIRHAQLAQTALIDNNRSALIRAVQVVQRLKMGGFRFDSPASCYLSGRPIMIAFE